MNDCLCLPTTFICAVSSNLFQHTIYTLTPALPSHLPSSCYRRLYNFSLYSSLTSLPTSLQSIYHSCPYRKAAKFFLSFTMLSPPSSRYTNPENFRYILCSPSSKYRLTVISRHVASSYESSQTLSYIQYHLLAPRSNIQINVVFTPSPTRLQPHSSLWRISQRLSVDLEHIKSSA